MNYRIIEIYNLMDYEFSQVEGNFSSLRESDFIDLLPCSTSFQKLLEQLRTGHSVLLTDVPTTSLLIQDRDEWNNKYWRVNPDVESNMDELAINAYTRRLKFVNHGIGSSSSGSSFNTSMSVEPYIENESKSLSIEERLQKQRLERQAEIEQAWADIQKEKAQEKEQKFYLGWMQVDLTQSQQSLWANIFTSETTEKHRQLVKKYNSHLNNPVRQGEIVVLPTSEPSSAQEQNTLSNILKEAKAASSELVKLTDEDVATVYRHFELLDYYASNGLKYIKDNGLPSDEYAYTSVGVGAIATGIESHLKHISGIIQEVNDLYVTQVAMASRTGGVNYGSFISERVKLLNKLDKSFTRFSSHTVKMPAFRQVKKNLRLSTKSIINHADEILAKGTVPSLGKRIANISRGVSNARGIGYIGLALGATSGVDNIYEACNIDDSGECGKTVTREIGGFLGGWEGGVIGGYLATGATVLVLGALSITSAPVIAVSTVGAAVIGGAAGGVTGGM